MAERESSTEAARAAPGGSGSTEDVGLNELHQELTRDAGAEVDKGIDCVAQYDKFRVRSVCWCLQAGGNAHFLAFLR